MAKYKKGQSGNPKGRPPGIEDKRVAMRAMLEPHAEELIAKIVAKALDGDSTAMRICADRLLPTLKPRDEAVTLDMEGSLADKGQAVLKAASEGRLTPGEAAAIMQAISSQSRVVEVDELERRVKALEEKTNAKP